MHVLLHRMVLPMSLPVAAGLVCLLLPRRFDRARAIGAVVTTAVTVLLTLRLFRSLDGSGAEIANVCRLMSFRLDALSGFIIVAVAGFGFLCSLYSVSYMAGRARLNEYYAYLLWTVGLSCGAVLANHLILLLILWGMLGATLYLLIGMGGGDAAAAAKKTFIIVGGSDCLLMLGIAIVWGLTGEMHMDRMHLAFTGELSILAFLSFAVAGMAKAGAMPFHSWVPDCGEKAPLIVSAFLPASLDKLLGIYLLFRVVNGLFVLNQGAHTLLMLVGAGTVICAVMMALVQHDLKRLLSYHAVSQVGYMVLGLGCGTLIGLAGGLFHMLNHAIYKCLLFMCAGAVEKQTGTTELDKLGGLARVMPVTFGTCVVAALAISGVPPLNGFASKWMIYQGIVESGRDGGPWGLWLVAAMFGSALTLASFVKVLHAVFLRKPASGVERRNVSEVDRSMWMPMAFLAFLCVLFGVFWYRIPFSKLIAPAIDGDIEAAGMWWSGPATVALLASIGVGLVIYFLTSARRPRVCETYIGGETLASADIPGEPRGATRDLEVSGAEFYQVVENITPFSDFYRLARAKAFDIYDVGTRVLFYFVEALRAAHTGRLPVYLTWFVAGFLILFWLLT